MGPVPRRISIPRPHKAFGLCALGFTQFKADGLVQTYGLHEYTKALKEPEIVAGLFIL